MKSREREKKFIYIYIYICRKVIREPKMRENDRYILNSNNKTKAVWQVISKEIGKSTVNNKKIEINWGSNTS